MTLVLEILEFVCAAGVVWWTLCRGRYMSGATAFVDRVALTLLSMGALAHGLTIMHDWTGLFVWTWLAESKTALLFPGVFLWLVMPPLRAWRAQEQARASEEHF